MYKFDQLSACIIKQETLKLGISLIKFTTNLKYTECMTLINIHADYARILKPMMCVDTYRSYRGEQSGEARASFENENTCIDTELKI